MTTKIRSIAYSDAFSYADPDAYISDMALSYIWADDPTAEIPSTVLADRTVWLIRLWHIAHDPVRQLLGGRTMAEAADELCMPYRTLQQWCSGDRPIAPHLRLWLAEMLGYR